RDENRAVLPLLQSSLGNTDSVTYNLPLILHSSRTHAQRLPDRITASPTPLLAVLIDTAGGVP
ncbi:hypothetical protein QMN58_30495, partial [Escherichia coli]|nr:hypothetical protein [Escherichia coli]